MCTSHLSRVVLQGFCKAHSSSRSATRGTRVSWQGPPWSPTCHMAETLRGRLTKLGDLFCLNPWVHLLSEIKEQSHNSQLPRVLGVANILLKLSPAHLFSPVPPSTVQPGGVSTWQVIPDDGYTIPYSLVLFTVAQILLSHWIQWFRAFIILLVLFYSHAWMKHYPSSLSRAMVQIFHVQPRQFIQHECLSLKWPKRKQHN